MKYKTKFWKIGPRNFKWRIEIIFDATLLLMTPYIYMNMYEYQYKPSSVILNEQESVFPLSSVPVNTTVVLPRLKTSPDEWLPRIRTSCPELSVAVIGSQETADDV